MKLTHRAADATETARRIDLLWPVNVAFEVR